MKNILKILSFAILILPLSACNNNNTNSSIYISENPSVDNEDSILFKYKSGYSANGTINIDVKKGDNTTNTSYNFKAELDDFNYHYYQYEENNFDNLKDEKYYYADKDVSPKLLNMKIRTFDNSIMKTKGYNESSVPVTWDSMNLMNPFLCLYDEDIKDEDYVYKITPSSEKFQDNLSYQLLGFKIKITSLEIQHDEEKLNTFNVVFKSIIDRKNDTTTTYSIKGEFYNFGSNNVSDLTPLTQGIDQDFENKISQLKNQNYSFIFDETTNANSTLKETIYKGKANKDFFYYDAYDKDGNQQVSLAYKEKGGLVKQLVKGNDNVYFANGEGVNASLSENYLPSFKMSSIYFEKDSSSTENEKIYNLKSNLNVSLPSASIFTPFNTTQFTNSDTLKVIITSNSIKFIHDYYRYGESCKDIATFENIGSTENDLSKNIEIKDDCKDSPISNFLTNYQQECASKFGLTKEVLDNAYLAGGNTSLVTYDFDTYKNQKALLIKYNSTSDTDTLANLLTNNLASKGYSNYESKDKIFTNGTLYSKELTSLNLRIVYECIKAGYQGSKVTTLWIVITIKAL